VCLSPAVNLVLSLVLSLSLSLSLSLAPFLREDVQPTRRRRKRRKTTGKGEEEHEGRPPPGGTVRETEQIVANIFFMPIVPGSPRKSAIKNAPNEKRHVFRNGARAPNRRTREHF
jgi:hypothetical protein